MHSGEERRDAREYERKLGRGVGEERPRKHFESGGALAKRGTFVYDQNRTILFRTLFFERFYKTERKFLKIWSLYDVNLRLPQERLIAGYYDVENGLYRVFTTAKRALSFQQKKVFIQ
jgi:hypothetical protein